MVKGRKSFSFKFSFETLIFLYFLAGGAKLFFVFVFVNGFVFKFGFVVINFSQGYTKSVAKGCSRFHPLFLLLLMVGNFSPLYNFQAGELCGIFVLKKWVYFIFCLALKHFSFTVELMVFFKKVLQKYC